MPFDQDISPLVDKTPFVDTHEHLWEEKTRLEAAERGEWTDFGVLFRLYSDSDLLTAGMSREEAERILTPGLDPRAKWRILQPYYDRARNTGYMQNVRESVRMLYGVDDVRDDTVETISEQIAASIAPRFYGPILRESCNIEYAQVNSLETPHLLFMETDQPDLLAQDLGFNTLSSAVSKQATGELSEWSGVDVRTLDDFYRVQDWAFETYAPRAIAMKNQGGYDRGLDYVQLPKPDAVRLFERMMTRDDLSRPEQEALAGNLFHRCIDLSVEHDLPVKLHTGYHAGNNTMPLHRVGANPGDVCELLRAHPDARFVLMHMSYPYQDQLIAICKHYTNAWADMCWAWIANPVASVRFVKEFLMAAPANKLLTFGGDYMLVEMVPGHAVIARRGLTQAIAELVEEGWVDESDVPDLVDRVMRGNAHDLFDYEGTLAAWNGPDDA